MKYLKLFGLAALAAMAVMAVVGAGTASADELCTKNESPCATANLITELDSTLSVGKTAILESGSTVLDTCTAGTVGGKVESQGAGKDISGKVSSLTWGTKTTECSFPTTTIKNGSLTATATSTHGTTVTGIGNEVTVNTGLFGSCVFSTGTGVDLGTVAAGSNKLVISATVNKVSGLCPSTENWTAEYTVTNHTAVYGIPS